MELKLMAIFGATVVYGSTFLFQDITFFYLGLLFGTLAFPPYRFTF